MPSGLEIIEKLQIKVLVHTLPGNAGNILTEMRRLHWREESKNAPIFSTPIRRKATAASTKGDAHPQMLHRANGKNVNQITRNPEHKVVSNLHQYRHIAACLGRHL